MSFGRGTAGGSDYEGREPLPTLLVGLGGSGAWTLTHVKQQLFETYNNVIPDNIAMISFDTTENPSSQVGGGGESRSEGDRAGSVGLDPKEYGFLGGKVKPFVERVARGEHPHLKNWLLANWYLSKLPENLFNLDAGAGQYRQFGRLALFRDVAAPNNSRFYSLVKDKLNFLKTNARNARALSVFIVGSITGGTGAGLFLDTAYLVRRVAEQTLGGMSIYVRGYFYLPEAFAGTIPPADINAALPRSYGGMRELRRFLLNQDWQYGYPMYYVDENATVDNSVWRNELRGKLYDLVYLVDGNRQHNPLNNVPLNVGSAPSVADAILTYIDPNTGNYQNEYAVNLASKAKTLEAEFGPTAFVGALGTFSVILPIEQIMEKWAYQLAFEAMSALVAVARADKDGFPLELEARNLERQVEAAEEVRRLMTQRQPQRNPRDPQAQIAPTTLLRKLYDFGQAFKIDPQPQINTLKNYDASGWLEFIRPERTDADRTMGRLIEETARVIGSSVTDNITTGDKLKPREDAMTSFRRLDMESQRYIDGQIGALVAGGKREGGRYKEALTRFVDAQLDRFQTILEWYTYEILNSADPNSKPREAKYGKLAWLISVYTEMREVLANAGRLLDALVNDASASNNRRNQAATLLDAARRTMREETESGKERNAFKAQEAFLGAVDQYMQVFRAELARDAVAALTLRLREFLDNTLASLRLWQDLLALSPEGLYAELLKGGRRLQSERQRANDIQSREVIDDPEWEDERYAQYVQRGAGGEDARDAVMKQLSWDVVKETDTKGQLTLRVRFLVNGKELNSTRKGDWKKENLRQMLDTCRGYFSTARQEESVLRYLQGHRFTDREREFAEILYKSSGALLHIDPTAPKMTSIMDTTYLQAYQNPDRPGEKQFLERTFEHMKAMAARGSQGKSEGTDRMQTCEDRFRLTILSMVEMVPLDGLTNVKKAQAAYLERNAEARSLMHIFGAEVNAVKYEEKIASQLRQEKRILRDRVSIVLEDFQKFREFLQLMAHGLIFQERDQIEQVETQFVFYLIAPTRDPMKEPGEMEVWWLTPPSKDPSLLEAMVTYLYHGEDMGQRFHNPSYRHSIDYRAVRDFLLTARTEDTQNRVAEGKLNTSNNAEIGTALSATQGTGAYDEVVALTVQHDMLRELRDRLDQKLKVDLDKTLRDAKAEKAVSAIEAAQELYDLYSVAIVALEEETVALRRDITQRSSGGLSQPKNGDNGGKGGFGRKVT